MSPRRSLHSSAWTVLPLVPAALLFNAVGCSADGEGVDMDQFTDDGAGGDGWGAAGAQGVPGGASWVGAGGSQLPPRPATCGNGAVDAGEACDGGNVNGQSCASATMNAMPTGTLACTTSCTLDTSGCSGGSGGPGTGGAPGGSGGMSGLGGSVGEGGAPSVGGAPPGAGGSVGTGTCCPSGDCLCHGPDPSGVTSRNGSYQVATFTIPAGTVHYPTNAEGALAGVAVYGGFLNTGPEMAPWGPFYASHGIVTVITTTTGADLPDLRATKLLASITQLKAENTKNGSPLFGKMAGRYGTSGYSMGGGGTTIASTQDATLRTSVGLAAWAPVTRGINVPTLLLCGSADTVAPCSGSQGAYTGITGATPKMMVTIAGATHFNWFGPTAAGGGVSGETALAFQKVFLEGDERWRPILKQSRGTVQTNVQ